MQLHTPPQWRTVQRHNFTRWDQLARFLELDSDELLYNPKHFPLNLPKRLAEKIKKNDLDDPILLQFLPTSQEKPSLDLVISPCTPSYDPVGDEQAQKTDRLLHKYHGRALLICTSACAMHCRYCFRQHYDYPVVQTGFEKELLCIQNDPTLSEILLSGGDPLSLSNQVLQKLITDLSDIPHVKRVRFHTRFPMGIPERIDAEFLNLLKLSRLQFIFVIHSNHPNEWDIDITRAIKKIQYLGIPVLSQTVLLKGINDNVDTLTALCEILIDQGIIPYYLHQLDRVIGALHFEVDQMHGLELIQALQKKLPGYAVPKYVREISGEAHKTPLW